MITLDRLWRAARFTSSYADPETSESEDNLEDDFEEGLNFQDQDESIAGIRRRLSDEASVSRVGEALNQTLGADRDDRAEPRDHFSPVQVRFPVNAPALRPPVETSEGSGGDEMPDVVNFDAEDKADGADAAVQARHIKVEFDPADVRFWFAQLEDEMTMAGVGRQWLKKTILQRNLPIKQKEDVKAYFTLQKDQAGDHIYLDIKNELIRIYAAKPCDSYRKALSRTMTGLPSQLGYQIVDDICKKPQKLAGCCCSAAALALWTDRLPVNVREHISNEDFNADTYKSVFNAADKVFMSGRPSQVAAVSASLNETQPAFNPHNQPSAEVAAIAGKNKNNRGGGGGRGFGRGGRGNRGNRGGGQNRGGGSNGSGPTRGTRHASVPDSLADKLCSRHYTHADQAWYCLAPTTCPWKNKCVSRPEQ